MFPCEKEDAYKSNYLSELANMDREQIFCQFTQENLKCLSNEELCRLFKFLSCFFCCLCKD